MSESDHDTATISPTEIMIRNLRAAGYSEEDIHYEMDGYGCVQTLSRVRGCEQTADAFQETVVR